MYKGIRHRKKGIRGSVTVLVTMLLVPCVFFTGFMVDLARLKLFSNQGVMTADTYGAAVLSEYDGYLYSLYGLFAISQDGDLDMDAISEEIIKTYKDGANSQKSWMPYGNAKVDLSYELIDDSTLSHETILETQIADYMKYRIIISIVEETDGGIIDTIDQMQHIEENLNAAEKMEELTSECNNYTEKAKAYYKAFDYVANTDGPDIKDEIDKLNKEIDEYNSALNALADAKNLPADTEEEQAYRSSKISEAEGRVSDTSGTVNEHVGAIKEKYASEYDSIVQAGNDLIAKMEPFESKKQETISYLTQDGVNEGFSEVAQKNIEDIQVVDSQGIESLNNQVLTSKNYVNQVLGGVSANGSSSMNSVIMDCWTNIRTDANYQDLKEKYDENSADERKAKAKSKKTQDKLDETADGKIEESNAAEESAADSTRDIPGYFASTAGSPIENLTSVTNLFTNLKSVFNSNSIVNTLVDDYYTVEYDYGMFTNRTTGVKDDEETPTTLVGYEFSPEVNYSYLGEIEYLIAGHTGAGSAKQNLADVRNRIIAFRMLMNYISTYTCTEVNTAITTASAVGVAPPVIFAINQGMRITIASLESYADWDLLKKGEETVVLKNEVADFSCVNEILSIVDDSVPKVAEGSGGASEAVDDAIDAADDAVDSATDTATKGEIKLDYEDYTKILLFFFTNREQRIQRTGDLIEMNVNCVAQGLGASGTLSSSSAFELEKAYTAVDATCKCQLPFSVMPKNFAQQAVPDKYGEILQFEKNYYSYTVTRSY